MTAAPSVDGAFERRPSHGEVWSKGAGSHRNGGVRIVALTPGGSPFVSGPALDLPTRRTLSQNR